jgi:hypothetical protein
VTEISPSEVQEFIARFDSVYGGRLSGFYNYPRVVSLAWLQKVLTHLGRKEFASVGIVSGSRAEPELGLVVAREVALLNFQEDPAYDLDASWEHQAPRNFALTLCNQVLEHVFNPHLAFRNLVHHTRADGGLIFVSIPTINCIHGEPHFYSSGYHPRFLERLARANDLGVIGIGFWGTPKYMVHAVSGVWPTATTLQPGLHGLDDCRFPNLAHADGRNPADAYTQALRFPPVITDCWGLFIKR